MATNLRLDPAAAEALREAARRSGRSQQELLRSAVDRFLGLDEPSSSRERAVAIGLVRAPSAYRDYAPQIMLGDGLSSADLLARDDDR